MILLQILAVPITESAVVIDDFEDGPFSLQTDGTNVTSPMGGLDHAHVIGGTRNQFGIDHDGGSGFARAVLTVSPGDDSMRFTTDPTVDAVFVSSYNIPSGVDLTEGGLNSRMTINVLSVTGSPQIRLRVRGGGEDVVEATAGANGLYSFLFSDYTGVDFTNVDFVSFQIHASGTGSSIDVAEIISDIPEPDYLLLGGSGMFGFLFLGRRRNREPQSALK